jgi:NAD(P)H-flavin reductase
MSQFIGEIIKLIQETPDVKTFRITKPHNFTFIPGQYCLVSFLDKIEFMDEARPFTFTSSPTQKDFIDLTIKLMGDFTKELFKLDQGTKLQIDGPKGESLNFDENIKENVVFIAGGSGITPCIVALRYATAKNLPNKMMLFFSNKTFKDIIYGKELEILNHKNITIINTISDEIPGDWHGETGRINKAMIEKYVKIPSKWLWYVCGPPPMVTAIKNILHDLNIPEEKLRIEEWQLPGKSG